MIKTESDYSFKYDYPKGTSGFGRDMLNAILAGLLPGRSALIIIGGNNKESIEVRRDAGGLVLRTGLWTTRAYGSLRDSVMDAPDYYLTPTAIMSLIDAYHAALEPLKVTDFNTLYQCDPLGSGER